MTTNILLMAHTQHKIFMSPINYCKWRLSPEKRAPRLRQAAGFRFAAQIPCGAEKGKGLRKHTSTSGPEIAPDRLWSQWGALMWRGLKGSVLTSRVLREQSGAGRSKGFRAQTPGGPSISPKLPSPGKNRCDINSGE